MLKSKLKMDFKPRITLMKIIIKKLLQISPSCMVLAK